MRRVILLFALGATLMLTPAAFAGTRATLGSGIQVVDGGDTPSTMTITETPKPVTVVNFPNPQNVQGVLSVANLPAIQNVVATNLPLDETGRVLVSQRRATRVIEINGLHVIQGVATFTEPLDVDGYEHVSVQSAADGPIDPTCRAAVITAWRNSTSYPLAGHQRVGYTDDNTLVNGEVRAPILVVVLDPPSPTQCPNPENVYRLTIYLH